VDPSFGKDQPHFDPKQGKVEQPAPIKAKRKKKGTGPRLGADAAGPPPTEQVRQKKVESKKVVSSSEPIADWEDDLAPHKIGGGAGSKLVAFLLLLSLVLLGFFAVVTVKNDGFIDFQAFPQMLEVAFSDGKYEPRP